MTQPWTAWDGTGFNARMGSPYVGNGGICQPVQPWGVYLPAVTYNTVLKKFLAVGQSDKHLLVAMTSPDLIHWSAPQSLRPSLQGGWWKPFSGNPDPEQYFHSSILPARRPHSIRQERGRMSTTSTFPRGLASFSGVRAIFRESRSW